MPVASFPRNTAISADAHSPDDIIEMITRHAGALPQVELAYDPPIKTLWITLSPEPRPVFSLDMLTSINKVQRTVHALWGPENYPQSPIRFVTYMHKLNAPIFTLGGDLEFYLECIAKNDRAALGEYARISIDGMIWNASCLKGAAITTAAVRALALGGGIDAPRSCNVMIAERQASFSYPEIKFNHFPIGAVAILSRIVGTRVAHEILSSGKEYTAEEFAKIGVLDAAVDEGEGEAWLRKFAADNLRTHAARLALFGNFFAYDARSFEEGLAHLAKSWTDYMIRLSPIEISYLQKIVAAQDHFLTRAFRMQRKPHRQDDGAAV